MAKPKGRPKSAGKVGSDREAAHHVSGKGDFGVPVDKGRTPDLDYTSRNTKASDRGAAQPRSSEFEGDRTHGAGGSASGVGSSSGGDLDPDIIGLGTGGGISASGPDDEPGPETNGTARGRASGAAATGQNLGGEPADREYRSIAPAMAEGEDNQGRGSDAVTGAQGADDDSFQGEISGDEAEDADKPTQGD